jgi:Flp pilus assembly protein TadB
MSKTWFKREKYIAIHGQSKRFRIVKYCILLIVTIIVVTWKGWMTALMMIVLLAILGILVHFLFRWKTSGWTKQWGLFKVIKTPFDT